MKIKADIGKRLKFSMQIENATSQPQAKFTVICDKDQHLSFPCEIKDGLIYADVPNLNEYRHMLKKESHAALLEVMVDGSYFKSWEGEFDVEWPVAIKMFTENPEEEETVIEKEKPSAHLLADEKDEEEDDKKDDKKEEKEDKKDKDKDDEDNPDLDESHKVTISHKFEALLEED